MPRDWRLRLADMLTAIERIEKFAKDDTGSEMVGLALERAFEILSEASRHLPSEIKARSSEIRWQDLADLGNIIRHAYDGVSLDRLRETARRASAEESPARNSIGQKAVRQLRIVNRPRPRYLCPSFSIASAIGRAAFA